MSTKKLVKNKREAKISGVCAGLSDYFEIDVTIVRLVWVLLAFFGVGSPVLIYIIMAIVLPNGDGTQYVKYEDVDERYSSDGYQNTQSQNDNKYDDYFEEEDR